MGIGEITIIFCHGDKLLIIINVKDDDDELVFIMCNAGYYITFFINTDFFKYYIYINRVINTIFTPKTVLYSNYILKPPGSTYCIFKISHDYM